MNIVYYLENICIHIYIYIIINTFFIHLSIDPLDHSASFRIVN